MEMLLQTGTLLIRITCDLQTQTAMNIHFGMNYTTQKKKIQILEILNQIMTNFIPIYF